MKKDTKERLYEVMSRLDHSFINEKFQSLNETERVAYTNLMKLFQENNMQSAKFIGIGYFMGKEIKKRIFPTEQNEKYARDLIENPQKYNISQYEIDVLKQYIESEIWQKTKRGERLKKDKKSAYAFYNREDEWSIIQLTRYTIKYMTPEGLGKSYSDMSDKEIELRRKHGFGKDYPEDDWRWKKGPRGGYTYGGAGERPIAGKGGSSYVEKMGDFPLYGDVDKEGKSRIDPETGYQRMALRQNVAEHVAIMDSQYFLVDTDGKTYPVTYKFANLFLKEILNQSKKTESSVKELEKEEEEFANELKVIKAQHISKQFIDSKIAYITATVIDDETKEKKPIYFINDRINIPEITVDFDYNELKPYIMEHLKESYKIADKNAREYEAGLKENKKMKKSDKEKLFEMMGKLDSSFKNKINERYGSKFDYEDLYYDEPKDYEYEEVVFMQDHESEEALRILDEDGVDAALEYLKQWHNPGEHMTRDEPGHGSEDKTYEKDNYIMSWNPYIEYIGLVYKTPKMNEEESMINEQETRPLYEIAAEIKADWKNVYFGAKPYLDAMMTLDSIDDNYMFDSGRSIVAYFLANAQTWRGETAKRIKKELNSMLKK